MAAPVATIDRLKNLRVFARLPDALLHVLLERCQLAPVRAGAEVQKAGDVPTRLSIVLSGQMRVVDGRLGAIDTLGSGAHFGESMLDGTSAAFSVYAVTDAELLQLSGTSLNQAIADEPIIGTAIQDDLAIRHRLDPDGHFGHDEASTPAEPALASESGAEPGSSRLEMAGDEQIEWTKRYAPQAKRRWRPPFVRQERPSDAGPACLATICRHYGRRISLSRLREATGTARAAATVSGLQRASASLGFDTKAVSAGYEHLARNHLPAIAGCDGSHWVVVYRADDRGVTVADPANAIARLSRPEFEARWTRETLYLRPTDRFADVEESRHTLARFLPYIRPFYRLVGELIVASVVVQLLNLLFPIFAKFVIDDVIGRADPRWLTPSLIAMGGVLAMYLATSFSRRYLLDFISRQVNARLLADFYKRLVKLPVRFFETRHVGDLVSRFEETGKITQFFTRTGVGFFIDMVTAALYVALMAHYNGRLTGVALLFLIVEVVTLSFVTPHLERGFRDISEQQADSDGLLIESLSGLQTIKMLAIEHYIRWRLHNALARTVNASLHTLTYRTIAALATELVNNIGTLGVLFYGAVMVLRGQLTVGELIAFGILTRGLIAPFAQLVAVWDGLHDTLRSVEQLNDVFETEPEVSDRPSDEQVVLHKLQGHIRFDSVSFRYEDDAPDVLSDVSFECYGGQRVAILGRSGSGKSTLIKLLLGFYRPSSGTVSVDGFDLGEIWSPSLRRQTGVVLQEPALFRGSIRSNISHTMPTSPLSEIVSAATMVNAHRFISALPQGYETELDEHGANLSGGQRQQVALARALLHTPRMLILDEATSNLDNESERLFHQNLDAAFKDGTVVTITQRLDAVRGADLILVLDRGAIVEQGSHEELLARQGLYHRFTREQAS